MNSNKKILEKVREFEKYSGYDMTELKNMLEDNIREESVKDSKKGKSELSIIKNLFKDNFFKDVKPELYNKTIMTKDFFTYLTPTRVYYTRTDLGYDVVDNPFKITDTFIQTIADMSDINHVVIDIDVADLTAFIKIHSKDKLPYAIKINKDGKEYFIGFNPNLLMDSIKFTNNNSVIIPLNNNNNGFLKDTVYNTEIDENQTLQKLAVTLPIYLPNNENMTEFKFDYTYDK